MIESNTQKIAGLLSCEEQLNAAIDSVLAEYPAMFSQAPTSLTWLNFMVDQVLPKAPNTHPLEIAREIYVRSAPTAVRQAISDAFTLGTLIGGSARARTAEFNAKAEAEAASAFRQIQDNWSHYHQRP